MSRTQDEYRQLLKECGGEVRDMSDEDAPLFKELLEYVVTNECRLVVLSDDKRRTLKYLVALALGVTPLRYTWVDECLRSGFIQPVARHALPRGVDKRGNEISDVPPNVSQQPIDVTSRVLYGTNVHLEGDAKFKERWSVVCSLAGAKVIASISNWRTGDVVISDKGKSSEIGSQQQGVKIVDVEWLLQSLIQKRK